LCVCFAKVPGCTVCLAIRLGAGCSEVRIPAQTEIFLPTKAFRLALETTQLPTQRVPGVMSQYFYTYISPVWFHDVDRKNFSFFFFVIFALQTSKA
jgi:hypothetical protein